MIEPQPDDAPIRLKEAGREAREWTLTFSPTELRLSSPGAPEQVVPRAERFAGITRTRAFVMFNGSSPLVLEGTPEARARLDAWMGPPTRDFLRLRLKRLVSQGVTTGGAMICWALFFDGPRGPGLFLGLPLLVVGALSYFVVHRGLFAAMAVIYAVNVFVLFAFIASGASPWLAMLALLILFASWVQIREYQSFAGVEEEGAPAS